MDTATTEYLFCCDFFAESEVFRELFQPIVSAVEAEFTTMVHVTHFPSQRMSQRIANSRTCMI